MNDERPEVAKGTQICPECGEKLVPIVYGLPGPEASEAAMRREIALGGCLVTNDDPQLACVGCEARFWVNRNK